MESKYLNVLVMPNGEVLFLGKSIGWADNADVKRYLFTAEEVAERESHATAQRMADTREAAALLTLRRMNDKDFNDFLKTCPARAQLLVRGRMVDWETVLPAWYVVNVMEPERIAKARKQLGIT